MADYFSSLPGRVGFVALGDSSLDDSDLHDFYRRDGEGNKADPRRRNSRRLADRGGGGPRRIGSRGPAGAAVWFRGTAGRLFCSIYVGLGGWAFYLGGSVCVCCVCVFSGV